MEDLYAVLGVERNAASDVIQSAYRRLALLHHPDKNPADPTARIRFQWVALAYDTLSDPSKRSSYDRRLNRASQTFNPLTQPSLQQPSTRVSEDTTFEREFGDVLREEIASMFSGGDSQKTAVWSTLGSVSGAVIGFIVANIPGAIGGFFGGRWLGSVRDEHGKSVMEVYGTLTPDQKTAVLLAVAKRVLEVTVLS